MADIEPTGSALVRAVLARLESDTEAAAFALPDAFGGWFELSAGEFLRRARALAAGLMQAGLAPGDVLAVLCGDRFEVALIDVAAALARVVVLPLSPAATATELLATLEAAGAQAVVVESVRDFARFDEIHADLPLVAEAWQIGLGDLDKLAELGAQLPSSELDARVAAGSDDDVASLLDDGAGGRVAVRHGTLLARVEALADAVGGRQDRAPADPGAASVAAPTPGALGAVDSAVLQILPPTDPTARVTTLMAVIEGARLAYLGEGAELVAAVRSFRPTLVVGRPDAFAEVERATLARAEQTSRGPALKQALEVAALHSAALEAGTVPRGLKARFVLADALVLRGLRKAVGGRVQVVVSVSGPTVLSTRLRHLMRALDIRPLETLAFAETGGPAFLERWDDPFERPEGAVGGPVPGIDAEQAKRLRSGQPLAPTGEQ